MTSFFANCLQCGGLPSISIIKDEDYKVHAKCICGLEQDYNLGEYNTKCLELLNQVHNCDIGKNHPNNQQVTAKNFCIMCNKWICDQCFDQHDTWISGHRKTDSSLKPISWCPNHINNDVTSYCIDCRKHFCQDCAGLHTYHNNVKLGDVLSNENKEKIEKTFNEARMKIYEYNLFLKNKYQALLNDYIGRIERAYETAKKINDDMTLLFGAFLNCYNVSSLNYQTLENIITNGKFSMTELSIDDNLSTQNLEKVISFIENNLLCKGKKALHEALVLKRTSKPTNISNINQMLLWKEDKLILSGNEGVWVYDKKTMNPLYEITKESTKDISLIDDAHLFVANGTKVSVFQIFEGGSTLIGDFIGHKNKVTKIIPLSEGKAASASDDFDLRIWTVATYKQIIKLKDHKSFITALLELKAKSLLVSGSDDGNLKFWDLKQNIFGSVKCVNMISNIKVNPFNSMVEMSTNKLLIASEHNAFIIDTDKFTIVKQVQNLLSELPSSFIPLNDGTIFVGGSSLIMRVDAFAFKEIFTKKNAVKGQISNMILVSDKEFITSDMMGEVKEWEFTYN